MKWFLIALGGFVAVVLVFVMFWVGTYNGLVGAQESVNEKWGQVQTNYQRRADLIPNLVETVKGVAKFEKETMIAVVQARAQVGSMQVSKDIVDNPQALKRFDEAQSKLSGALSRL